jgi:drug/metabolite transporter (DMT)-like permease
LTDAPLARRPRDLRPYLALLAVQLCFGSFPIFGKLALSGMEPLVLAAFRAIAGAAALTLLARILDPGGTFDARDRLTLAVLSFFGIVANQVLFALGLSRTTATNATLLTATVPVLTVGVAAVLAGERPSAREPSSSRRSSSANPPRRARPAAAFIFAGIALATWPGGRSRPASA